MAAREVESPLPAQTGATEVFTDGRVVPPRYRRLVDNYTWVVMTIDTTQPKWPILYVNAAFLGMTGEPLLSENATRINQTRRWCFAASFS